MINVVHNLYLFTTREHNYILNNVSVWKKTDETVLKSVTHEQGFYGPLHIPGEGQRTTYSTVELDQPRQYGFYV